MTVKRSMAKSISTQTQSPPAASSCRDMALMALPMFSRFMSAAAFAASNVWKSMPVAEECEKSKKSKTQAGERRERKDKKRQEEKEGKKGEKREKTRTKVSKEEGGKEKIADGPSDKKSKLTRKKREEKREEREYNREEKREQE